MKVEQEGTGFSPITITLETQEEADIMWAVFNCPVRKSLEHSYIGGFSDNPKIRSLHQIMFESFDDVYQIGV